jgi:TPR repeat protein
MGQHNIACFLDHSIGVQKDLTEAADYFTRSVALGDPQALPNLQRGPSFQKEKSV